MKSSNKFLVSSVDMYNANDFTIYYLYSGVAIIEIPP
jgi:hypothetical protein